MSVTTALHLSRYVVASPPLRDIGGPVQRVVMATRTGRTVELAATTWDALVDDRLAEVPDVILADLSAAGVLTDSVDELAELLEENETVRAQGGLLYQVVQPTAACQLGCDYCGQEHANVLMSPERQDAFLDRVDRRLAGGGYDAVEIGWFGAEPLMGLPVMRRLSPLLRDLARSHACRYAAKVVTNGIGLTRKVAAELAVEHAVSRAEITLDGPRDVHDTRRIFKRGGGGSYDRILANLRALRDEPEPGLDIVIRCNVNRDNADRVDDLIDALAGEGLQETISFYLAPVYSWGNDADRDSLQAQEYAQREVEWLAHLHARGFPVGLLPGRRPLVCLAVHRDAELVDAHGTSFNCTEVSYVPTYGRPNRYALVEGRPAPFADFNAEIAAGDHPSCATCSMLPVCGGSCPKLWSEGRTPCPSAKHNLPERLLLAHAIARAPRPPEEG